MNVLLAIVLWRKYKIVTVTVEYLFIIFRRYPTIYTVRKKLSTAWRVSIISFLIMNLFQIGLLFSLPVYTYLPVKQVIDRFFERKLIFLCRVLSFIFYWFGIYGATKINHTRKINQFHPKCQKYWRIKNCYLTGVTTVPPRTA